MKIVLGLILLGLALSMAGDLWALVCQLVRGAIVYFIVKREEAKERRHGDSG